MPTADRPLCRRRGERPGTRTPDVQAWRPVGAARPLSARLLLLLLLVTLHFGSSSPRDSAPLAARRRLEAAPSLGQCAPTFGVSDSEQGSACTIDVPAGSKVFVGTTFLSGASCTGDTWLELLWNGDQVAYNDDFHSYNTPYSTCSLLSYTVPSDGAGTYTIQQGCLQSSSEDGSCSGVVAVSVVPADTFSCAGDDAAVCAAFGDLFAAYESTFQFEAGWFSAQSGISTQYCAFSGVSCTDGVVTKLDFSTFQSFGDTFPDSVINAVPELTDLVLAGLQITGTFPTGVLGLTALTLLDLSFNQLEGSIPDGIGSLTALEQLLLLGSDLSGSIPDTLCDLTQLTNLCVRACCRLACLRVRLRAPHAMRAVIYRGLLFPAPSQNDWVT